MIDEHVLPNVSEFGVRPVLFYVGDFAVPSYTFFLGLAIMVGVLFFVYESKKAKKMNENTFFIAVGALIGATLGAKIPIWFMNYDIILHNWGNLNYILSGRTIVGGLIGGPIGVVITKKILGIKERRGNMFAPAIAIGDFIGRLGCFLRGCCAGKPTSLPWGVDFGDGILRHPTQLYESIFALVMFAYIMYLKRTKKTIRDGELFIFFMNSYFIYRFFIEFIRTEQVVLMGLTIFQIGALGVLIYLNRKYIKNIYLRVFQKMELFEK